MPTQSQSNKAAFLARGQTLPICVNLGCNNPVIVRDWLYYSFKHYCSDCNSRIKKGLPPRFGVTFIKKNYCENRDGRLGFLCPVHPNFPLSNGVLHGDHKDGNHYNNTPENHQTLCSICHHYKGMMTNDFNSAQKGRDLQGF